jgi:tRNA-specific 2-thiouridylase
MTKAEVRACATELGFPNADQKGSQDACFAEVGENLAETLRKAFNGKFRKGFFVAPDGTKLGPHQGIQNYTIGQRKGLGIALGKPGYVSRIDYDSGDVVVTTDEDDLLVDSMIVDELNWQQDGFSDKDFDCEVQIRYRSSPVKAKVVHLSDGSVSVRFAEPRRAVTPGQAAVFFVDDCVAGGGWIRKLD